MNILVIYVFDHSMYIVFVADAKFYFIFYSDLRIIFVEYQVYYIRCYNPTMQDLAQYY